MHYNDSNPYNNINIHLTPQKTAHKEERNAYFSGMKMTSVMKRPSAANQNAFNGRSLYRKY